MAPRPASAKRRGLPSPGAAPKSLGVTDEIIPPQGRTLGEVARLARGLATLPATFATARRRPRGGGHPVLVVPGFMTGDGSTLALRRYLRRLDYRAEPWGLGRNTGQVRALTDQLVGHLERRHAEVGKLRLVGWSLGGVLSREAARQRPDLVDRIVTMGTPVIGGPKYTLAADHYRKQGLDLDQIEAEVREANATRLPVPVTAIYSRRDGVVAWRACLDDNAANDVTYVEVRAGHAELGFSGEVLRAIAHALAP